jgi:hypothetical protein
VGGKILHCNDTVKKVPVPYRYHIKLRNSSLTLDNRPDRGSVHQLQDKQVGLKKEKHALTKKVINFLENLTCEVKMCHRGQTGRLDHC